MSKVRVYELAKDFGMKGPEMAKLLRQLGFEKIKSHMAVLDTADEMMVVARLEAQGLSRKSPAEREAAAAKARPKKKSLAAAAEEGAVASAPEPKKKALPKKPLPVPRKTLPKKRLPSKTDLEDGELQPVEEPAAIEPELEPAITPEPELQPEVAETAMELAEATPVTEPVPVQEPAPAEAPTVEAPIVETPAIETPAVETPAVERPPVEAPPAPDAEAPVIDAAPAAPEVPAGEPAEAQPAAAAAEAPAASQAKAMPDNVKRLLVPKAKAQVVGRIELPQETIRDATRRSAPASDRERADRDLRRTALQATQRRTATRTAGHHQRRGPGAGGRGPGREGSQRGRRPRSSGIATAPTVDLNKLVEIEPPVSLKALSEGLGIKVTDLIATLTFKLDVAGKTINSFLTEEEVELVAIELERKVKVVERREAEEELIEQIVQKAEEEDLIHRAPVLTLMGHVDHGKTTLLDRLRASDIVKGEAGGITQHIGAYKVQTANGKEFVILDTPGHAAFTAMRARGASVTDLVVLVVAADDGVMPQTEEAINHAKAAGVPIVVAVTKCDLHGANTMQVRQQLAVKGLQPEEWGGEVGIADVSALTGEGLDGLIERIMLEAEILELEARPESAGRAIVVESKQTPEQGVVVTVLVMDGTMRVKDRVLCGESYSRVRGMIDDHGSPVTEAGPATPVTLLGLDKLPMPGDKLYVVNDSKKAKEVVEDRQRRARDISLAERSAVTLETLSAKLAEKDIQEIKLILKADVMGSLEPLKKCLDDLNHEEVRVNLVHSALGGINETDVSLAEASGALIIGFNAVADQSARMAADRAGVEIRFYDVIYELLDDMRDAMEGLLAPAEVENVIGHADVRATFKSSKFGTIAGCYVTDGIAKRNAKVRLSRDGRVLYTGKVASLRRINDDAKEVRTGFECGMTLSNFQDIKDGDILEFAEVEYVKRTL